MKRKGFTLVRRFSPTKTRWLVVGQDGWTVARANTIAKAKIAIDTLREQDK